jgi:hypothetical protein
MGVRVLRAERKEHPEIHHRRGWMRIGINVVVWCTCGWKFKGPAKESEVTELWNAHIDQG